MYMHAYCFLKHKLVYMFALEKALFKMMLDNGVTLAVRK